MSNQIQSFQYDDDINHGGLIRGLLNSGFTCQTALFEGFDNSMDSKSTKITIIIDKLNKVLYFIDNGTGANKTKLKKLSKIYESTPSDVNKHGMHCAGAKYFTAYITQLFEDSSIINKPDSIKTPMERVCTTIIAISKCNDYNKFTETSLNEIPIDYITPLNGGIYKNEPRQVTPLNSAIWKKLSENPELSGTIICMPMHERVFDEFMKGIDSKTVESSYLTKFAYTYEKYLKAGNEIQIKLVDSMSISINDATGIELNIDNENPIVYSIIPYDPLHYNSNIKYKQYTIGYMYIEITLGMVPNTVTKELEEKEIKRELCIILQRKQTYFRIIKNIKKQTVSAQLSKKEFDKIKSKHTFIKFEQLGSYSDDWTEDIPFLQQIIGTESNATDRKFNNMIMYERNGKIIYTEPTPKLTSGNHSRKKSYENSRFKFSYDATMDPFIKPLIKKSNVVTELIPDELKDALEWDRNQLRKSMDDKIKKEKKEKKEKEEKEKTGGQKDNTPKPPNPILVEYDSDEEEEDNDEEDDENSEEEEEDNDENSDSAEEEEEEEEEEECHDGNDGDGNDGNSNGDSNGDNGDNGDNGNGDNGNSNGDNMQRPNTPPSECYRRANTALYLSKTNFIDKLEYWKSKPELNECLKQTLYETIKHYKVFAPSIFDYTFHKLNINELIDLIKLHLNDKYKNDTDNVDYGAEFSRAYNQYISNPVVSVGDI